MTVSNSVISEGLPDGLLVSWYGDDFTGSAATMEVLEFAGLPSVLFLKQPTAEQLARFENVRGLGIASTARAHSPEWMDEHLPSEFEFLKSTGAPICHYKICSTLDSSPTSGSVGRAIDIAKPIMQSPWIPCQVAAPVMRRFQAFGNLFAAAGESVYRLDRHPVMARHPVTPMAESDVGLHLAKQTQAKIGVMDIENLQQDPDKHLQNLCSEGVEVVSCDAMSQTHIETLGRLYWEGAPLFAVGSQGVEYSLVAYWRKQGWIEQSDRNHSAGAVDKMLAVSGSVSPVTALQLDWAEQNGFALIELDASRAAVADLTLESEVKEAALAALQSGQDPLIFTARGPDDPAVARMRATIEQNNLSMDLANSRIGAALGRVLAELIHTTGIRRAVISGGDTSGYVSRELDLYAFTALAPTIPGASLLAAHSDNPDLEGLELALKGGQMGSADYFGWIKRGAGAMQ